MKSIHLALFWLTSFGFLAIAIVLFLKRVDDFRVESKTALMQNEELKKLRLAQFKVSRAFRDQRNYQNHLGPVAQR